MIERPILFSGPMVRSILAGTKTQTRRLVKPQPLQPHYLQPMWGTSPDVYAFGEVGLWREVGPDYPDGPADDRRCPYGAPGDRFWIRETWRVSGKHDGTRPGQLNHRITLEVTAVRAERLQSITEEDAKAEGVRELPLQENEAGAWWTGNISAGALLAGRTPRKAFAQLWESINRKRAPWSSNPWVWAVSFRRVSRP